MKIGVFAQYINTRNDIRDLISALNKKLDIVLFLNEKDKHLAQLTDEDVEVRFFNTRKYKYRNYFYERLFKLFGKLPKSKNNYYITENFKLYNSNLRGFFYFIEWSFLRLSKFTPKFISYKRFLSLLKTDQGHLLKDIDIFFCITQIYNDILYAAIQKTNKPVINYVYSWDHACKMKCFLSNPQNIYLTWSTEIKNDVHTLQGVNPDQIHVLGATQFMYLNKFLGSQSTSTHIDKPYIYMVGGTGNGKLLTEEIAMMELLIKSAESGSDFFRFKIRPYPFVRDMSVYNKLASLPNVEIESMHAFTQGTSQLPADFTEKYKTIQDAVALFHFGTTLSLEAAHLHVPVILIDTAAEKNYRQLHGFIHQYQNDKYLNLKESPNILRSTKQIPFLMEDLREKREMFLPYNSELKKVGQAESIDTIIQRLVHELNQAAV